MKRDHGPHGLGDLSPMLIKVRSITGTRPDAQGSQRSEVVGSATSALNTACGTRAHLFRHRERVPGCPETAPRLPPKGKQVFGCACEQASDLRAPLRNRSVDLLLAMDHRRVLRVLVRNLNRQNASPHQRTQVLDRLQRTRFATRSDTQFDLDRPAIRKATACIVGSSPDVLRELPWTGGLTRRRLS